MNIDQLKLRWVILLNPGTPSRLGHEVLVNLSIPCRCVSGFLCLFSVYRCVGSKDHEEEDIMADIDDDSQDPADVSSLIYICLRAAHGWISHF